jgi:hypothetical protein
VIERNMEKEDKQFIVEFGVLAIFSAICVVATFLIMTFIFFYGDPFTIVLCCILVLLRIKVCNTGTEITLIKALRKYMKVSVTIMK